MNWLLGFSFGAGLWLVVTSVSVRVGWLQRRRRLRAAPARVWPAFYDDVASGLRAGLALAPAVWQAGRRLPLLERRAFEICEKTWLQQGGLSAALEELASQLNQRSFFSFVELIKLAATHGSPRLATLVSELAEQSRNQLALTDDIHARQSATVNAAKVAVAAPWAVLALTMSRPDVREVYSTPTGVAVLLGVAITCALSYLAMRRLARIEVLGVWD